MESTEPKSVGSAENAELLNSASLSCNAVVMNTPERG